MRDGQAFLAVDNRVLSVPLGGGTPTELFSADSVHGLAILNDRAYFTSSQPVGDPIEPGKQMTEATLASVALSGGASTVILTRPPAMTAELIAQDDASLYFGQGELWTVSKLTPPATSFVSLPLAGKEFALAIARHGGYLYVAGAGPDAGVSSIQRVPISQGPAQVLLSGLHLVSSIAVDASGIYFTENAPDFTGTRCVLRAGLDGSSPTVLVEADVGALALAYGRLYYATGDAIFHLPKRGGTPEKLASADRPGVLRVADGNLVWLTPVSQSVSGTIVPLVQTTCLP